LPALPHTAAKLLKLVDDPNSDSDQITAAIATDAAIASSILKVANSSSFAQHRRVLTIPHALSLVGRRSLKCVVVAHLISGLNRQPTPTDLMVRDHAVATALLVRGLAQRLGRRDAEDLFLYGMLHRLGQFILLSNSRTRSMVPAVLRRIREQHEDYVTAEWEEIGFAHPTIGGLVAHRWNFPPELSEVMLRQETSFEIVENDTDFKTGLVKFASLAAHVAGIGTPDGYPDQRPLLLRLGIKLELLGPKPEAELAMLIEELQTIFKQEAALWSPG
jgi:HD-like signal output (HDOD) protein